jgi:TP901 family phage tail tape measure protein
MSAGAVRAGKAFVEITANDTDFQRGLKRAQHGVVRLGAMLRQQGSAMAIAGGAMGLPMVMAARSAATFEDALLELKGAAADLSKGDLKKVRDESLRLSSSLGVAPEKVSQAFALLVKAGMTVKQAMGGGAKAAVEFAKVAGVDATVAAEFMSDSMNVFGVTASEAANTLSAAADSSSTSIAQMVEGFGQIASVGKITGQSLFGVSQAMAVLAGYGLKGEEGATALKTMLTKLIAPSSGAKEALATLGISMGDLVDNTGRLLPMQQIAGVFEKRFQGMGKEAIDTMLASEALVKVFDVRGMKVISSFIDAGTDGFDEMAQRMEESRTVSEKFKIAMSGISGFIERLTAAVQRFSIAFMVGAGPAMSFFVSVATGVLRVLSFILERLPFISGAAVTVAVTLFTLGTATYVAGGAMAFLNVGLKTFINFGSTYKLMVGSMTLVTGGFTKSLIALRAAMFAIPGWGWALAGLAVAGGVLASMKLGSGDKPGKKSGLKRDAERQALGGDVGAMGAGGGVAKRGEGLGTFSGMIASQLGIGPALTAQEETADNTGRMADGVDQLVRQGELRVPAAAGLQIGMAPPSVRGGVAARSDRDLVSMSERAAMATEESRDYLRQLLDRSRRGGLAFA